MIPDEEVLLSFSVWETMNHMICVCMNAYLNAHHRAWISYKLKLAEPVKKAYAKEIDATEVLEAIDRVR